MEAINCKPSSLGGRSIIVVGLADENLVAIFENLKFRLFEWGANNLVPIKYYCNKVVSTDAFFREAIVFTTIK